MDEAEESLQALRGDKKMKLGELLRRSLPYVKTEWKSIFVAFLLILINVAIEALLPYVLSRYVDLLSEQIHNVTLSILIWVVVGYGAMYILGQGIVYLQTMVLAKAGARIVERLRNQVFAHIESMSQNQFNEMPVGSLVTRVANYTSSLSDLFTGTLIRLTRNILTLITVSVIMFTISYRLTLFLMIFFAVAAVFSYFFWKYAGEMFHKERSYVSDMNTFLSENLNGMKITQIFNQEKRKDAEFAVKNENLRKANFSVVKAFAFYRPFIALLLYGSIATTFGLGVTLALSAAEIVAFYLYVSRFFNPIQSIADELNAIQRATTAAERLYSLLDVEPEVRDAEDAIEMDHFEGKIEFRNVWFAYEEDNWILKDVSFVILPKQSVAFVGATGAGKTTILSLICRNYDIQKGQILIDDIDISKIKLDSLRKAIGQMLQDVFLFSSTIKENITLRDDSFSDEQVKTAAEYVNASSFISRLPKGYEEEVIERGENFSVGQRQLLSFARTVLHNPQILILDEATANIDAETEHIIQSSLEKMRSIGTMLIVAHRLSTIQHCDNIIALQNGQIIEQGSHQELLKKKGYYHKLYQLQFEHQKD